MYIFKANAINAEIQNVLKKTAPVEKNSSRKVREMRKLGEEHDQPEGSYIENNNVSISLNQGQSLQLANITPNATLTAFGNPINQSTEYSEDYGGNILTYNYNNVKIYFLNNSFLGLDIEDEGAFVNLKLANGQTLSKYVGAGGDDLNKIFNSSWANRTNNNLTLWIKTPGGIQTDASIVFTLSGQDASITSGNYINRISILN